MSPAYAPGYNPYAWGPAPAEPPAPGKFHPASPPRSFLSLTGRAAPKLYLSGWLLTLIGLAGTLAFWNSFSGIQTGSGPKSDPITVLTMLAVSLAVLSVGIIAAALAQSRQRRADGWLDYWGPSPALTVLCWISLSFCIQFVVVLGLHAAHIIPTTISFLVLVESLNVAAFVGILWLVVIREGALSWSDLVAPRHLPLNAREWWQARFEPFRQGGMNARKAVTDLLVGAGLAIPCLIGTVIVIAILVTILGVTDASSTNGIPSTIHSSDLWWVLLAAAVLAPIGEELFFRGYATNAWARSLTRNSALLRAGVLFASIHLINLIGTEVPLDTFVKLAILGVVARLPVAGFLGWVYVSRRSILASMALHAAYNGILIWIAWQATNGGI